MLWFALIFGAMYYYLSRRYLPAVGGVIEARRARIAKDIDEATAMQAKADAAAAEHEKSLAEARADAQATAQAARDKVAAETDAKRKALEDQLARQAGGGRGQHRRQSQRRDGQCLGHRQGRDRRHRRAADRPRAGRRAVASAVDASAHG